MAAWLAAEVSAHRHAHDTDPNRHGEGIHTFAITPKIPVSRAALGAFMQMLADQKGDELLRLKGLVALEDDPARPAVVHGAQHVAHPLTRLDNWPEGVDGSTLVFIVRNIDKEWAETLFEGVAESAYASLVV